MLHALSTLEPQVCAVFQVATRLARYVELSLDHEVTTTIVLAPNGRGMVYSNE